MALRRTPKGILVSPGIESKDFEFRAVLLSDPPCTGKPENCPPAG
ncbi:MAG: hypothetical protein ABC596_00010 [Candidatus Methanosuratincola petrocarbonis]